MALMADDIQPGDEVIIPGHTYCATAIPFGRQGATIKWADIDPDTFEVSAESVRSLISEKTKAIIVVHLYGLMCDVETIADIAKENDIMLVEDCAQALGASYKGQKCGNFGDISLYSFQSQKNIRQRRNIFFFPNQFK